MEARTREAIFVDFVGEAFARGGLKSHAGKEIRNAREKADAGHLVTLGLAQECLHEQAAGAMSFRGRMHRDGTYFGEMRPVEVKRAAADDFGVVLGDHEV